MCVESQSRRLVAEARVEVGSEHGCGRLVAKAADYFELEVALILVDQA